MSRPIAEPGSFRDPGGRIYHLGSKILRSVTPAATEAFEYVQRSGIIQDLSSSGQILPFDLVSTDLLRGVESELSYVLETPRLDFISFPYEWCFNALKEAALLHLDIQLATLQRDVTLSDASAYNIQFQGAKPVFIDHLSFIEYVEGDIWRGHAQFCAQFLNPLILGSLVGIPHNAWYRGTQEGIETEDLNRILSWRHKFKWNILSHVVLQAKFQNASAGRRQELNVGGLNEVNLPKKSQEAMLNSLRSWIRKLEPNGGRKTTWQDYAKSNSYDSEETNRKYSFIREFAAAQKPNILWDFGCNIGNHCIAALESGAKYAVGFDFDHGALNAAFKRSQEKKLPLQVAYLDAANPSPSQGWASQERQGLKDRSNADAIFALAFVHHLAIARNIPFDQLLDWIMDFAPSGVIEFVPKNDPMVKELLMFRPDIFPNYTEEFFLSHIGNRARIVKSEKITSDGRLLVWFDAS